MNITLAPIKIGIFNALGNIFRYFCMCLCLYSFCGGNGFFFRWFSSFSYDTKKVSIKKKHRWVSLCMCAYNALMMMMCVCIENLSLGKSFLFLFCYRSCYKWWKVNFSSWILKYTHFFFWYYEHYLCMCQEKNRPFRCISLE